MKGPFDPFDMSPDDCVTLVEMVNSIIIDRITEATLENEDFDPMDIDRASIVRDMTESSGLEFDEIVRFCEIGEYILLDRELREMDEDESRRWKMKREAVIALIDSLIEQAIERGIISREDVTPVDDPTLEMLEQMWRES